MKKKGLKIVFISLLSITTLFLVVIALVLNFVMTPERITPLVNKTIAENIDGECEIGNLNISYFSTFPNLAISVDSIQLKDSSDVKVAFVEALKVEFRPLAYIFGKFVIIEEISLIRPDINIITDSRGVTNFEQFMVVAEDEIDTLAVDTSRFTLKEYARTIDINKISIIEGSFNSVDSLYDRTSSAKGLTLSLQGSLLKRISNLKFNFACEDINMTKGGFHTLNNFKIEFDTNMEFNRDSLLFTISNADVILRNIDLTSGGTVRIDKERKGLDCNLKFNMAVESLKNIIERLPKKYLEEGAKFYASGSAKIEGEIKGLYNKENIPNTYVTFTLDDGKFKFDEMDYGVEELDILALINIDGNDRSKSTFNIEKATLISDAGVKIDANAKGVDILGDCNMDFSIYSDVDLSKLSKILPVSEAIVMSGENKTEMNGKISLQDIMDKNYGALFLDGKSNFKDLLFTVDGSMLPDSTQNETYLYVQMERGDFNFGSKSKSLDASKGDSNLSADIAFSGVGFKNSEGIELNFSNVRMSAVSQLQKDTTKVIPVLGELDLEKTLVTLTDTISGYINSSIVKFEIKPDEKDETIAVTSLYIRADSAGAYFIPAKADLSLNIASANINIIPDSTKKSNYGIEGIIGFNDLKFFSKLYPVDMNMNRSKITFKDNRVDLEHTTMVIGNSDFTATGWMKNFLGNMMKFNEDKIISNLKISSKYIDLGELYIATLAADTSAVNRVEIEAVLESNAKEALEIFTIPNYIRSRLNLNVEKVKFGDINGSDINGEVILSGKKMDIDSLSFTTLGSTMNLSARYIPKTDTLAEAFFNLNAKRVKLDTLMAIIPSIDTIMPMLKSVEGIVDFDMTAKSDINKYMMLELPTLESVMNFNGRDLVLLDGETFEKVSKMLMFKNKKRNLIDSLSMDVVVKRGGVVNVPPFEFEMDRYRAIIGGTQTIDFDNFDIDYKYNVSIIKSPLPIKAGVDITGVNDDFKYKITKAKLKHSDFTQIQANVDSLKNLFLIERTAIKRNQNQISLE